MRKILVHIVIRLYTKKFEQLRDRLLVEYELVKDGQTINYNILSKILISGEDHRFYYHIGFDLVAIVRAIRNKIFYQKIEGASTIEQQLVRVLTNQFERTIKRKIQEIILSTTISSVVPKSAIPKIYLNVAYYGAGMNGLKQTFSKLGICGENLQIEKAAEIVSRIKYPQPSRINQNRLQQIEMRKKHLVKLYNIHSKRKLFNYYD